MKTNLLINPYYCYLFSFGMALFIYSWGWSEIYPALSFDVTLFLITSFSVALYIGKKVEKKIRYEPIPSSIINEYVVVLIITSYVLEFLYNGGIPIITLLKGGDIAYMDFGIPTFHVVLHTFTGFYTIYIYHQYLSCKRKKVLFLFIILLFPNIMIVNRGALIMTLTACIIIYLFSIKKILLNSLFKLIMGAIIFFYGFGYLGNARSFNGDPTAFLKFTKATDTFVDSSIPKEYYWFYIYASSPFANFQNATITSKTHRYDIASFVTWELLPDFISKRIIPMEMDFDGTNRMDYSINPILTVGSVYFEPYIRLGWAGPVTVFLFYVVILYFYIVSIPRTSKYFVSGLAVLSVMSIFNMFENMINFSGLSFQLVFPLILSRLEKYKFKLISLSGEDFKLEKYKIRLRL